ncbi:Glu/Leu/Phe/Val dehydrogenase dimerization domain-containing protein [Polyangium sp. 15x6]|uniref:Glu/Leu/Phe/Val family dehydrogenase n=1 Tax=Polyangium sp. 15x6 TaxID=3042687 RepID=UPI00249BD57F|nr:Glu/Leu/Phe/Val dehydrogenase dimerization domain-containing protein [Polyangium sp. 15x6]MDI3291369.1 Glu/Leu/Phe/Val dehydrogenase dimerization domain-containing protein [Polyangium sp. 15x6]
MIEHTRPIDATGARPDTSGMVPFGRPPLSAAVNDENAGLNGWVVVDSLLGGRAMGGTRMTPGVDARELATLARTMTYKLALAGMPIGGAKAGLVSTLQRGEQRDQKLIRFGELASPLMHGGVYLGSDQGISYRDRDLIHQAANFHPMQTRGALPCSWGDFWSACKDVTGHGVCLATCMIADHLRLPQEGRTVAIQGFGVVGRGAARGLVERGYKIVAVADRLGTIQCSDGLPVDALLAATDEAGTIHRGLLPRHLRCDDGPDRWLSVPADLLVLAASGDAVHARNAGRVEARAIVEGANNPCSVEALHELHRRGIAVVPDIVANSGGATVTALCLLGLTPPLALDSLIEWCFAAVARRVRHNCAVLFRRAAAQGKQMHAVSYELASENLETLRAALRMGKTPADAAASVKFTGRGQQ